MSNRKFEQVDYLTPIKRLLLIVLVVALAGIFLIWRIDSPRMEQLRARIVDRIVPNTDWLMAPVTGAVNIARDVRSYARLHEQNQELRRELQQMKGWKEAAVQLEQENARLLELNNVRLNPNLTYVTGVVLADSGSPFRQSVLLNIGARDGILDGWAAMDGLGLVGRISGVGHVSARVLLLTDTSSHVPVTVQPSGSRAMLIGDNTAAPVIDFIEDADKVRPGDRVITSGDGGVFPSGLLVGQVAEDKRKRLRVWLAADYERLEYLRVLRNYARETIRTPGTLVNPARPVIGPEPDGGAAPPPQEGPPPATGGARNG